MADDVYPIESAIKKDLGGLALQVGGLLNLIENDDRRDDAENHFWSVLCDELVAGARNRADVTVALSAALRLVPAENRPPLLRLVVPDEHSKRV